MPNKQRRLASDNCHSYATPIKSMSWFSMRMAFTVYGLCASWSTVDGSTSGEELFRVFTLWRISDAKRIAVWSLFRNDLQNF